MKEPSAVIRTLQVTEKGTRLREQNKYFFDVAPDANRIEIKKAVESLFRVRVTGVNTMNYLGKRKRERRAQYGRQANWKRAVVTLHKDDTIEME